MSQLKRKAKDAGLVSVFSGDPKEPLFPIDSPAVAKAFGNIMRKAGFTDEEVETRLRELWPRGDTVDRAD